VAGKAKTGWNPFQSRNCQAMLRPWPHPQTHLLALPAGVLGCSRQSRRNGTRAVPQEERPESLSSGKLPIMPFSTDVVREPTGTQQPSQHQLFEAAIIARQRGIHSIRAICFLVMDPAAFASISYSFLSSRLGPQTWFSCMWQAVSATGRACGSSADS
jgi:hypothetical protein